MKSLLFRYALFLSASYLFQLVSSLLPLALRSRHAPTINDRSRTKNSPPFISHRVMTLGDTTNSQEVEVISAKESRINLPSETAGKIVDPSSPESTDFPSRTENLAAVFADTTLDTNQGINQSIEQFSLWKKRLITREDPFSIHKSSGLFYTLSSTILLGTAAIRLIDSPDSFAVIPDFLAPVSAVFVLSNVCLCLASIRMASISRRNDIATRNAFFGTASSSLFSCYFFLWISPFAPEAFNDPLVSGMFFAVLSICNIAFITDTVIRSSDAVEGRLDAKKEGEEKHNSGYYLDVIRYVLPGAVFLPVIISTWYVTALAHDRAWFLQQCDWILAETGYGYQASVYYNNVMASVAAAYVSLLVTLRDKKLISKEVEWAGIATFAILAAIWTVDVTVRFLPAWFR